MALSYSIVNDSLFARMHGAVYSITKIEQAERRLKEKKQYLEDVQNEYRLLEEDAYNTYKREVIYMRIPPSFVDKARKWLAMINNKENKIDKRKHYEEKDIFEWLTKELKTLFGKDDIKITNIMQYGLGSSANLICFTCQGHKFELFIPIIQNVSLQDYQHQGDYAFKMHISNNDKENILEVIDYTFEEDELKDILNSWLSKQIPNALLPKESKDDKNKN